MNFMSIRANAAGRESFAAGDIGPSLQAIRAGVPGVPVGVSTREGILASRRPRAGVSAWKVLPNYVSVNLSEGMRRK